MSSAVYGATRESMIATASAPSRTAGSSGPGPESMALRSTFTNSMKRATATLKRNVSTARAASWSARWVALRTARSPVVGSTPGAEVTSPDNRHARARNLAEPAGETSAQSTSSSGGPAKTMDSRMASTPCSANSSDKRTRFPRDLLIAEPSITTMPWFSKRVNGSLKSTKPMS